MHRVLQRYIHYLGNESSESLLEAYGIVTLGQQIDQLRPKQCPNCSEPNKPDSKFCAKCRMVLTYDAYEKSIEKNQEKEKDIENLKGEVIVLKDAIFDMQQLLRDPKKLKEIGK